ncbi:Nucleolin [Tupaia chinensis]|uniref:Nucleolin n=1 Tax=Tupaia chinensis TaxID=246437 RepID=L9KHU7_TUPCH|nr:Nucleolin [Tupaia chinensis]
MEIRIISKDGKSKGIAYFEFKTEADAKKTFEEKQGTEIDGWSISLYYTGEKGLSEDTTEETLKESFEGSVHAIVTDWETASSKGFGFVDFNSEEDAKAAKEAMEDDEIDGNKITLDWAKTKGEGGFRG